MGKKLTVYLIDGKEFGPKTVEIGNWVGKAIYSTRAALVDQIKNREEYGKPGVYFLRGTSDNSNYEDSFYIGEAENVGDRLKTHLTDSNKDFSEVVFFISKDELLTKSQIKYLESKFIVLAKEAVNSYIENNNQPHLPTLHEADISDMNEFMAQVQLILPLLGFNLFKHQTSKIEKTTEPVNKENIFKINNPKYNATLIATDDGYFVLKNSQANINTSQSMTKTYVTLKQKLLDNKILVESGEYLSFTEDTQFSSPSAASNIVLGRQSAGTTEWVDESGKPLKEVLENLIKTQ